MASPFVINNEGITAPTITMAVDTTEDLDFSQADIDNNLTACAISANNEVGMGADAGRLFGKVIGVSAEVDANGIAKRATVQVAGVARLKYVATTPVIGQEVELDGAGAVSISTAEASYPAGGHLAHGVVINVIAGSTEVDVLL